MKGTIGSNPYAIIIGNLFLLSRDKSLRKKKRENCVSNIITHLIDMELENAIVKSRMIHEWVETGIVMDWAIHDSNIDDYDAPPFNQTKGMDFTLSLVGTIRYQMMGDHSCKNAITIGYLEMMDYLRKIMYLLNSSTVDRSNCHCDYYVASVLEARVRFNIMEIIHDAYEAMFHAIVVRK